jgi:hypothetical protein
MSGYHTSRLFDKQKEAQRGTAASLRPQNVPAKIGVLNLDTSAVVANPETEGGISGVSRGIPIRPFHTSSHFNPQASLLPNISDFAFNYILTNGSGNLDWYISGRDGSDNPVSGQYPVILRPDGTLVETSNVVICNGVQTTLGSSTTPNVYNTTLGSKVYIVVGYNPTTQQWILTITPNTPTATQIAQVVADGVIPIIAAHGDQAQVGVIGQGATGNLHGATSVGSSASSTLAQDTDVNITNPQNGDVLTYNSTDQKWENKQPSSVSASISVIAFDLVSVDAGTSINDVARRIPLPANFTPTRVDVILETVAGTASFNIVWDNGDEINAIGATAAGATAVNGNEFFSTNQNISSASAGAIQSFTPYGAGAIYPKDGELTLRVNTSSSPGGVGNLKVVIAGSWS